MYNNFNSLNNPNVSVMLNDKFNRNSLSPISSIFNFEKNNSINDLQFKFTPSLLSMTEKEFVEIRDFIFSISGIYYTDNKKYLLEGRIIKRVIANNLKSIVEYIKLIKSASYNSEIDLLIDAITINETFFFRAEHQFETFEQVVVEDVLKNKKRAFDKTFNIWSAASSTGEEPFTLAMIIHDKIQSKYKDINFKITGTDISTGCLKSAKQGIFKEYSMRNIPPYYLKKYFKKNDNNTFQINDEIKRMVSFKKVNLFKEQEIKSMSYYDVIFCANVLIYFDFPTKEKVISTLYDSLNTGGYLFIGISEYLHNISRAFKLISFNKSTIYKKE
jgi:chemotaxis protein methyltransferase CheR